jgi:predicted metal-binding membrane protein
MSVGWMVLVAALIATEKLLPWRTVATRGIGSPAAMEPMERMGTETMQPASPTQMEDGTPAMP